MDAGQELQPLGAGDLADGLRHGVLDHGREPLADDQDARALQGGRLHKLHSVGVLGGAGAVVSAALAWALAGTSVGVDGAMSAAGAAPGGNDAA